MKKIIIFVIIAVITFPVVTAKRSFFVGKEIKRQQKNEQKNEIVLYATGYYHPEENQDFYASDSYESDLELNGRGITASGKRVRKGDVAVDPSVIPLGTEFYTEEYGRLIARDKGGRIKGDRVDIFTGDGQKALIKALKINGWLKLKVVKWGDQ